MIKKPPLPKPLFDTLETLDEDIPSCVENYLNQLEISHAKQEYTLTREFLRTYSGSPDTFTSYRRDVERLIQFSWLVAKKPLKEITRNDIRDYVTFSMDPPLTWIGTKNVSRFIKNAAEEKSHNPEWRPFVVRLPKTQTFEGNLPDKNHYQLKTKSLEALFAVIGTFFTFLVQEEYVEINPVTLVRQKNRFIQHTQTRRVTRKLSQLQWQTVIETAEEMAQKNSEHERSLFMFSAFYLLGLRISELAETPGRIPKMGDFAPDKNGLWWFTTVGKGNKIRDVAVPDAMLEALKRYRLYRGLSPLPQRDEPTPLLEKQAGKGGLGTRQVRYLVQSCFNSAIQKLHQRGEADAAHDLSTATVHWLRHTAISSDVEFRPREHIRDDVGHENPATLDRYIDTDRVARHTSAKDKKLK